MSAALRVIRPPDGRLDGVSTTNLRDVAVRETMLKPVRDSLESSEAKVADPSVEPATLVSESRAAYRKSQHLVRLGQRIKGNRTRIGNTRVRWRVDDGEGVIALGADEEDLTWQQRVQRKLHKAEALLKEAYRALLEGRTLDAEIELERAEERIQSASRIQRQEASWKDLFGQSPWQKSRVVHIARRLWKVVKAPLARSVWPMVVVVVVLLVVGLVVKVLEAPGWKFLVAVVLVGVVVVLALYLRSKPAAWSTGAGEWRENAGPWLLRVLFRFLSGLLSVVIAVTVVLAYQETVSTEEVSTWGTGLDLVVAIGLGVLAHRAVQSLRTASEGVSEYIGGGAKPKGDKAEEKADEKGSESPGGATPATPAKPAG